MAPATFIVWSGTGAVVVTWVAVTPFQPPVWAMKRTTFPGRSLNS